MAKRKKNKPKRRRGKLSRHHWHIIPSSRGGNSQISNIARIDGKKHEIYHHLFINKTPEEIIEYLVNYFWQGQWEHVDKALKAKIRRW